MKERKLKKAIKKHEKWLAGKGGKKLNLIYKDLSGAKLEGFDLRYANLRGCNLSGARLYWLNLKGADLTYVNLQRARIYKTDLSGADLENANLPHSSIEDSNLKGADLNTSNLCNANLEFVNLTEAYLCGVNFREATISKSNLNGAYLKGANFSGARLNRVSLVDVKTDEHTAFFNIQCPEEGSFIGWKQCRNNTIVKLLITKDAKRSSSTSRKCRCSEAKVLAIYDSCGQEIQEALSGHEKTFVYRVGETVKVNDFDENRWNECSTGIHFFLTKEEAKNWDW